jgi:hypothetical protein
MRLVAAMLNAGSGMRAPRDMEPAFNLTLVALRATDCAPLAGTRGAVRRASRSSNRRSARLARPAARELPLTIARHAPVGCARSYKRISADPIPRATESAYNIVANSELRCTTVYTGSDKPNE